MSLDLLGKKALFIYEDAGRSLTVFGTILEMDELFFSVKTKENTLLIPKRRINKIKLKDEGWLDDTGFVIPGRSSTK